MTEHVADYSWARPSPALLRAHFIGVARYLGSGAGKLLTPSERDALHKAGLTIALVWETSGHRMDGGAVAGTNDANAANVQADALGFPADRPIYFANDQNAATAAHVAYMKAAKAASKRPVGVYGSTALIDACAAFGVKYGWKVQTWGGPTTHACLQQMPNVATPVPGTDVNDVLKPDWGQWPYKATTTTPQEDSMFRITIDGVTDYTCCLGAFIRISTPADAQHPVWKVSQGEYDKVHAACQPIGAGAPAVIDLAAIAKAVNDDAAARLASK